MWRSHVGEGALTITVGRLPASAVTRSKQCYLFCLLNLQKQFEQQIEMQTTLEEIGREVCLCDVHVICM